MYARAVARQATGPETAGRRTICPWTLDMSVIMTLRRTGSMRKKEEMTQSTTRMTGLRKEVNKARRLKCLPALWSGLSTALLNGIPLMTTLIFVA
jgi:hypothetical protein